MPLTENSEVAGISDLTVETDDQHFGVILIWSYEFFTNRNVLYIEEINDKYYFKILVFSNHYTFF